MSIFLNHLVNTVATFLEDASVLVIVITFFISWIGCWLPIAAVIAIKLNWRPTKPLPPEAKLPLLVPLYLLAPLVLWVMIWLSDKSFLNYGFMINVSLLISLILGLALGLISLGIIFTSQFWLGWCYMETANIKLIPAIMPSIFLIALLVGGIEELVFRGFLLTELERDYPVWVAATISSLIFAVLHLVWEQRETTPQIPGLWLMGMMLVLARIADHGSLGIAWGLHTGLVWAIATIDTAQLITYTGKANEWWTGKNKKPLAGAAGIICLLVTSVILWLFSEYIAGDW
jgi:uncharacterized protein